MRSVDSRCETLDLSNPFRISRGVIDSLTVLVVEIGEDGLIGRGECVPSAEHMLSREEGIAVAEQARELISGISGELAAGLSRQALQMRLPAGPARNAVDCALWDLEAKLLGISVGEIAGVTVPKLISTAYTVSLADPEAMKTEAGAASKRLLLKLKIGSGSDLEAVMAVRHAAPTADIIVDVNGGWDIDELQAAAPALHELGVLLIEQPLPKGDDEALLHYRGPVPLCADESCHTRRDLDHVTGRYAFVNIKLDKTGGLTEALALARAAQERGLGLMVGCMAGTSLSMAPAAVVGAMCRYVDLDGPVLLGQDRPGGMDYQDDGRVLMPTPGFWG